MSEREPEVNSGNVGWADDIVAPRQEINALSLLYQETAIQAALDPLDKKPKGFLEAYDSARREFREAPPSGAPSSRRTFELTQELALFGAQAGAAARHSSRTRSLVSCVCPDRVGVLAELSRLIDAGGGNIEGAAMSIVAGHLMTVCLVSGLAEVPRPESPDLVLRCLEMEAEDIDWPRPGSTCWHARATYRGDENMLLELTDRIAARELPLMTLSSWRDELDPAGEAVEVVDLNFAVAPDPDRKELETIQELDGTMKERLEELQLDIAPVRWPARQRYPGEPGKKRRRDQVLMVVGHAQPGLVHRVLRTLDEDVDAVVEVRGASMAILEGVTVLTAVFSRAEGSSAGDIEKQIRSSVRSEWRSHGADEPVPQVLIADSGPGAAAPKPGAKGKKGKGKKGGKGKDGGKGREDRLRPTHELRLQVAEQPGVVMKVAELLTAAEVNITWLMSQVRDPIVGERWPICDIQMHLDVPEGKEEEVDRGLRTLTEREGWDDISFGKWSLGRQRQPLGRHPALGPR